MGKKKALIKTLDDFKTLLPGQSIDCVIFGFDCGELKVLVLKWIGTDSWSLPGGFIKLDEDLDVAAIRILQDRTGLELPFLEQFYTFGNVNRKLDIVSSEKISKIFNTNLELEKWFQRRFISTGYLSLVDIAECKVTSDNLSDRCEWKSVISLPNLIFDHNEMIERALQSIKRQINYLPIGINLLQKKFAMRDLQELYESILQRKLDRGNFQRKMLKLDLLIRLEKKMDGSAHKAPYLYSFDKEKYNQALITGIGFIN